MQRSDVLKLFPDATDAQITEILNAHHKEVQAEKKASEQFKGVAEENETLKAKIKELENKGLTEAELMQKKIEAQEQQIAELQQQNREAEITTYASSKGLVGDQAANIIKSFGGNVDLAKSAIDSIVGLKGEWETAAAQAKEQEIANNAGNPGGNNGGGDENSKTSAEQFVEQHFIGDNNSGSADIVSKYLGR